MYSVQNGCSIVIFIILIFKVWKYEAFQTGSNEDSRCRKFSDGKTSSGSSIIVAVKTLKDPKSEQGRQDLLNELEIMKLLDPHPNVVTLLGCCTERGDYAALFS